MRLVNALLDTFHKFLLTVDELAHCLHLNIEKLFSHILLMTCPHLPFFDELINSFETTIFVLSYASIAFFLITHQSFKAAKTIATKLTDLKTLLTNELGSGMF